MSELSDEQKQRIEDEEKYRQELRDRARLAERMAARQEVPPLPERWPPKSVVWQWLFPGGMAAALLFLIVFAALRHDPTSEYARGVRTQLEQDHPEILRSSPPPPVWTPTHVNIASGQWQANAGGYLFWTFVVPLGARNYRLTGNYTATGRFGNGIEAVVATESDFTNWINSHPARVFFAPGKLTTGNINVGPLLPGRYTLGFNNKFSPFSAKSLSVEVGADYEVLEAAQ
jgi:hypothetical protein